MTTNFTDSPVAAGQFWIPANVARNLSEMDSFILHKGTFYFNQNSSAIWSPYALDTAGTNKSLLMMVVVLFFMSVCCLSCLVWKHYFGELTFAQILSRHVIDSTLPFQTVGGQSDTHGLRTALTYKDLPPSYTAAVFGDLSAMPPSYSRAREMSESEDGLVASEDSLQIQMEAEEGPAAQDAHRVDWIVNEEYVVYVDKELNSIKEEPQNNGQSSDLQNDERAVSRDSQDSVLPSLSHE